MKNLIARFVREDEGQDLIEYVLLGALIAAVVTAGAGALGNSLNDWYNGASGWVQANMGAFGA